MKSKQKINLRNILRQIRAEGISMRRRFTLYIISAIILVLSLILLLLFFAVGLYLCWVIAAAKHGWNERDDEREE